MQTVKENPASPSNESLLIDVRTPDEFEQVHIGGSVNFPLGDLERSIDALRAKSGGRPLMLVCRTQNRSGMAKQILEKAGFEDLRLLEGGVAGWIESGKPVEHGQAKGMSLERQVRIGAGALVLVGAVLSLTVHSAFAGLSAFVGAGLIYAGVTDTCGMAMVLAKMPWNRKKPDCTC
ncbi:MAG: rhodanese-like domain-containing protein [Planctomycetota bacterium]